MGICFVGECWVAVTGLGTQSHLYYAMLEYATKGTKVVALIRKDLVDSVQLVVATMQAVVVAVGGYRIGGIYEKCSVGVHAIQDYVGLLTGWIGGGDWVLLGIWNAHHHTWSLDGTSAKKISVVTRYISRCALYTPHISSFVSWRPAFSFPPCPPSHFTSRPIHIHISPLTPSTPTRPHFSLFSLDN